MSVLATCLPIAAFVPMYKEARKGLQFPSVGLIDSCGYPCRCLELNPVFLQGYPGVLVLSIIPTLLPVLQTIMGHEPYKQK